MWSDFLGKVDEAVTDKTHVEAVIKLFLDAGIASPAAVDGILESDLNFTTIDELPIRAFARRAFRAALQAVQARSSQAAAFSATLPVGELALATVRSESGASPSPMVTQAVSGMIEVLGKDASALAVAQAMAHGDKSVPVTQILKDEGLDALSFHLRVDDAVWQLLNSENEAATVASRKSFSYVDLTCKSMLPLWMPVASVGGKQLEGTSEWLDPSSSSHTLGALGQALKAATSTPRFFRSLAQWVAVFSRYVVAAVAMGQLSWPAVVGHIDVVTRVSEESRLGGDSAFLALLYDDLLRRSFADRALKRDPALNIETEIVTTNKEILELAKSRLKHTVEFAGIPDKAPQSHGYQPSNLCNSTDSVLAKQAAAADALTRKAENAVRHMVQQQEGLERRRLALESAGSQFTQDGGRHNKQQQRFESFKKRRTETNDGKGGKGGKGKGKGNKGKGGKW